MIILNIVFVAAFVIFTILKNKETSKKIISILFVVPFNAPLWLLPLPSASSSVFAYILVYFICLTLVNVIEVASLIDAKVIGFSFVKKKEVNSKMGV